MKGLIYSSVLFFLLNQTLFAEALKEHTKFWTNAPISGAITSDEKWNYYLEPQLRFIDDKYKFEEFNLYAGIYYQSTPNLNFWLGAFRQYKQESDGNTSQEYRLWEQIGWVVIHNPKLKLSTRNRLEERKRFGETQVAYRIREKVTLVIPLKISHYSFVLADEVFLQLNQPQWVTDRVLSQNRAYIGISYEINKNLAYETGYLNQFEFGTPNQMSNILYMTLTVKIT